MLGDECPKSREAEHLAVGVMGLYEAVAVEQCCLALLKDYLVLLIAHPRHKPQGHPPRPQFLSGAVTVEVRQVVAGVGVSQGTPLRVEDGVEASYEHVGGDAGNERFVDPL